MAEDGLQTASLCAPMLTYEDVCSASVLDGHAFRLILSHHLGGQLD